MVIDDLSVGDLVTIRSWHPREVTGFDATGCTITHTVTDSSYVGDPMKVAVVQLPFVVLEDRRGEKNKLDTRRIELMRISLEYAKALGFPV